MTGRRLSSSACAARISSKVIDGGSGIAAIACIRVVVSVAGDPDNEASGDTGLSGVPT